MRRLRPFYRPRPRSIARSVLAVPLTLVSLCAQAPPAEAQAVPSPRDVLGYAMGERFTDHAGVLRYMEALAAAAPDRVEVRSYGESVEGRRLAQVVIAAPRYRQRLEEILSANRALADPATPEARAHELAARNPAVAYLSYGVHGNESSSSEAAMWTAWDLASGAAVVADVLDSVIVVIDPVVNPDGRDRYVHWYRQARGRTPNPDPSTREHIEPWPGGRFNHYLFDLNRDWAWSTQPETRARLATWDVWTPQVHVDFHEMGFGSSYFFFPAAAPINPLYPQRTLEWGRYFGASNAAAFDQRGWSYFTGESYDLFYPGYGDSWPSLVGAIGMTYEQAGSGRAGLVIERPDGRLLTLRERAEHHRVAGASTLRATALRKTELLRDFAQFHRAVDEELPDILIPAGEDVGRTHAMLELLADQGIRVERAGRAFRAEAEPHPGFEIRNQFPEGTYRVRARQPRGRLAITLLQPETVLNARFSYDVSAWSLPYAYGVESHSSGVVPDADWAAVDAAAAVATVTEPAVEDGAAGRVYGHLVAPGFERWPALLRYMQAGGRVIALDEPFRIGDRTWPAGTFFLPAETTTADPNSADPDVTDRAAAVPAAVLRDAGLAGFAHPVRSGRVDEGNDLGTQESYTLEPPNVAVLTGDGVSATSYGALWFFFDHTLELPFDPLTGDQVGSAELDDYDVIVLPESGRGALGDRGVEAIDAWVRSGGTLLGVGSAARGVGAEIADVEMREDTTGEADRLERALRGRAQREIDRWEEEIPGTIFRIRLDPGHPIAFGAGVHGDPAHVFILYRGGGVFEPQTAFETPAFFDADPHRVSGVISEANREALERGGWLVHRSVGQGKVILFADDPLFRHFWYSGYQLFANALLIGPEL